jgi:hypothetical protein
MAGRLAKHSNAKLYFYSLIPDNEQILMASEQNGAVVKKFKLAKERAFAEFNLIEQLENIFKEEGIDSTYNYQNVELRIRGTLHIIAMRQYKHRLMCL